MKHNLKGDTLTVWLDGDLDHHSAQSTRTELEAMLANVKIKRLIFDLQHLSFMDSSGIGVVLGRYKTMARRGGSVAVKNPCTHVDRIFSMSGIYQIVDKL